MADPESAHYPQPVRLAAQGLVLSAALTVVLAVSACATAGHPTAQIAPHMRRATHRDLAPTGPTHTMVSTPIIPTKRLRAETSYHGLTLNQLAGERVIYSYAGLQPPPSLLAAISAGEAAGVIFFGPNIANVPQIRGVIQRLQRARLASPVHAPLLMLTDQEGGEVRRLPGAPTLSEKQIGESPNSLALARSSGRAAGQELLSAGMNLNLAPVLDVYRTNGNFIDQFQRSYSNNSAVVASLGAAFITAQQATGVAATAKHFPGLGDATQSQNTDLVPVVINETATELRTVDEAPYRSAITAGAKVVMVSWARYPALDPALPAGLSSKIIQGELRGRLGFRGVTITDGIDAGAVLPFGDLSKRSVLAARAGADLILCAATTPAANTPAQGLTVMHAIAGAIVDHEISEGSAHQAASRVLALRAGLR
jgi:beta-N-acetylhexosaminidase